MEQRINQWHRRLRRIIPSGFPSGQIGAIMTTAWTRQRAAPKQLVKFGLKTKCDRFGPPR